MRSLSLVIPAHNAERSIEKSILEYFNVFSKHFKKLEFIIVCNACKDKTFEICNSLKSRYPLKIINVPERGKGNALVKGFNQAENSIIGFLDADNPFQLEEILKMINFLEDADIVIGTKFKHRSMKYQTSTSRRFFSISNALVSKILFRIYLSDTQAGAKFMNRYVWDSLEKNFICTGFEFDIELLYRIQQKKFRIKEYFLIPKESDYSTVKLRILPGMLKRLFILRFLK
ncbi:MAG: glycosyltransferase family 2 protein [Nanoarchaeota archaeon]|nr:glycosyltransferase family 2 protein [Nanoarchaeota archaeon]